MSTRMRLQCVRTTTAVFVVAFAGFTWPRIATTQEPPPDPKQDRVPELPNKFAEAWEMPSPTQSQDPGKNARPDDADWMEWELLEKRYWAAKSDLRARSDGLPQEKWTRS
jgi:hypothetical protein